MKERKKKRMIETDEFMAPLSYSDVSLVIKHDNVSIDFIDI